MSFNKATPYNKGINGFFINEFFKNRAQHNVRRTMYVSVNRFEKNCFSSINYPKALDS
jgi:hypothetical protein